MQVRTRTWSMGAALTAAAVLAVAAAPAVPADEGPRARNVTITSHDGTRLAATVHRPASADPGDPVPMIVHSHGWAGTRTSDPAAFADELARGFGVLSFDQRGHGESGGQAHVQDPTREGRDVLAVLDFVAELDWVQRSRGADGRPDPANPAVVGMGGSYGGAYQLVGALTETALTGDTRFDALAPEITWFDLTESLAPEGVVRSAWAAALYATGAGMLPEHVHRGFVWGASTGQWPDGSTPGVPNLEERFFANGPSGFVADGVRLDVPTLVGQGATDNLFNLNQGWHNFERTLTDAARESSLFIGYNGGHTLPSVLPAGRPLVLDLDTDDACSPGGFAQLRLDFFEVVLDGGDARDLIGDAAYHLTTAGGDCVSVDALDQRTRLADGVDVELKVTAPSAGPGRALTGGLVEQAGLSVAARVTADLDGGAATTTGAGVPIHLELAEGPLTVAGVPTVSAEVTSVGVEQRVFAALSVGSSPTTAKLVQNNMLPLREPEPVVDASRTVELPGVAVEVGDGERLFLTLSAVSDTSFGHGSVRSPGLVRLADLRADVPLVD